MRRPFFVAASEAGRYGLLRRLLPWAPFFLLFSRLSGPQVLNNKIREQIFLHIQEKPGSYYRSIQRDLGLAQGTLTHHLYTLERQKLIRRQRTGLRLRFFAASLGAIRTQPLSPWQLKVLEAVRAKPGISQSELARSLGLSRQALHYHIDQLRAKSLLRVGIVGRESNLDVGGEVWQRVGRCPRCATPFVAEERASQLRCGVCSATIVRAPTAQA